MSLAGACLRTGMVSLLVKKLLAKAGPPGRLRTAEERKGVKGKRRALPPLSSGKSPLPHMRHADAVCGGNAAAKEKGSPAGLTLADVPCSSPAEHGRLPPDGREARRSFAPPLFPSRTEERIPQKTPPSFRRAVRPGSWQKAHAKGPPGDTSAGLSPFREPLPTPCRVRRMRAGRRACFSTFFPAPAW